MSVKVLMPALSPTMSEGNLAKWLINEGDKVSSGQIIAEIETDKATMEVESIDDGILAKIFVDDNSKNILVGTVLAIIAEEGEDVAEVVKKNPAPSTTEKTPADASKVDKNNTVGEVATVAKKTETMQDKNVVNASSRAPANQLRKTSNRVFISPLAKRIATQDGLDINLIVGSGPAGRIIKKDVINATAPPLTSKRPPKRDTVFEPAYISSPTTTIRGIIADKLTDSKQTIPHFYLSSDVNIDGLLLARKYLNENSNGAYKISVNDMVLKAVASALSKVPSANVSWAGSFIKHYSSVDISVAVAIDDGLITPIIRDANYKSIVEISKEMKTLAKKAKEGRLTPEEFQGGTISVSNLGMFGVKQFSAIINPPQGCILAVGAGEPKPIVQNAIICIATVMNLTLSVDHRAIDGAVGAMFLKELKNCLQNPISLSNL